MKTNKLIEVLSDYGSCKPLPRPTLQALLWFSCATLYSLILMTHYGVRADIAEKLLSPPYILELCLLVAIAFSSALAAFCLARPDGYQARWRNHIPVTLTAFWAMTIYANGPGLRLAHLFESVSFSHFDCPWHIALFSMLPGLAIFVLIRRGAPIHCCSAAGLATLSATALGYLCMRIIEQNDDPAHLLIWHALPISLMCGIGVLLGRLALRWH